MKSVILVCALLAATPVFATPSSAAYIKDIDGLLHSVDSRDSSRPQLTLKLADAFYNEALGIAGQVNISEADKRRMTTDRRRSIQLYQDALGGLKGEFTAPSGSAKTKIQFQMARIYGDLGEGAKAEQLWHELANQEAMPDVQRESMLRLAEVLENRPGKDSLKQAETYYKKALALCTGVDVCSYSHYRLAWVYQREDRLPAAIEEMELALWDSKGQVREESLRDLLAFLGGGGDDGHASLSKMEALSAKIKRPQLIGDLADAYFAHGNRHAGVYVMDAVNAKNPTLKGYVRLLEEDYGFRDWTKFDTGLDGAMELVGKDKTSLDAETEKILRRLTVQLDGERVADAKAAEEFKKTVLLYLAVYPTRPERTQMIDGWLNAEKDDAAKIKQLATWIQEEHEAGKGKEEQRLRKVRAAVAQKSQSYDVVATEMAALVPFAEGAAQKREALYQLAYAQYLDKKYAEALPKFQELAALPATNTAPDKWAIQSEHLALDILAKSKDFAAAVTQAESWTSSPHFATWLQANAIHKDELADIPKVEASARFEWATSLGNTPAALAVFRNDCAQNVLLPKSCANAQVLAVKLGDQAALIEVLQKLGKKDELAAELEASAEFAKAAQLLEVRLKDKTTTTRDFLKVALLYELASSSVNRDRILHEMIAHQGNKPMGAEEPLILQTLKDAQLLNVATLKMAWSKENREYLTDLLATRGQATPDMQNQIAKLCHDTGPAWAKISSNELRKLDDKQKAIHFAGANSKRRFQARVAALKSLSERGNCYLQSTSAERRVIYATLLARSQLTLADEIKASPIPEGVDEEGKVTLQKALTEMAQPFADKGEELQKLAAAQLEKVDDAEVKQDLQTKIDAKDDSLYSEAPAEHAVVASAPPAEGEGLQKQAIEELHRTPNQRASLAQLKTYYQTNGNSRLAAYFEGRLQQLGEESRQ